MRITAFAFAAMLTFVLACGGDDDGSDTATSTPVADPTATSAADGDSDSDSDDSDAGGESGDVTSCNLLTATDLSDAGLEAAGDPAPNTLAPSDECRFPLAEGSVVVVYYTEIEATALSPNLYPDTEVVDGIGNEAWYVPGFRLAQARLSNGRVVGIQDDTDLEDAREAMLALLAAAAERS